MYRVEPAVLLVAVTIVPTVQVHAIVTVWVYVILVVCTDVTIMNFIHIHHLVKENILVQATNRKVSSINSNKNGLGDNYPLIHI